MADSASLGYASSPASRPPLGLSVRLRLSVMMFLQFAVWGSFWTVLNVYAGKTLHFDKAQIGSLSAAIDNLTSVIGMFQKAENAMLNSGAIS